MSQIIKLSNKFAKQEKTLPIYKTVRCILFDSLTNLIVCKTTITIKTLNLMAELHLEIEFNNPDKISLVRATATNLMSQV